MPIKSSESNHQGNKEMQIARNKVVPERTDPLAVKLSAKLSYSSCVCAEEEEYHWNCTQRFLSNSTLVPGPMN